MQDRGEIRQRIADIERLTKGLTSETGLVATIDIELQSIQIDLLLQLLERLDDRIE